MWFSERRARSVAGTLCLVLAATALLSLVPEAPADAVESPGPITARELLEVRDLSGLAVSPDGTVAVVRLDEPSVERNRVELSWYAVPLRGDGKARRIASAGDPMYTDSGSIETEIPQWSRDSAWIYYRALTGTEVQLWRTRRDGSATEKLTDDAADVESFVLDDSNDRVFYLVGATRAAILEAERKEYEQGVVYDETVGLTSGRIVNNRPHRGRMATRRRMASAEYAGYVSALGHVPQRLKVLQLGTLEMREASERERADYERLRAPVRLQAEPRAVEVKESPDGYGIAFLAPLDPPARDAGPSAKEAMLRSMATLPKFEVRWAASPASTRSKACPDPLCTVLLPARPTSLAWRPGTHEVVIVTRRPNGSTETTIRAWDVRRGTVRTIASGGTFGSRDRSGTGGCPVSDDRAICITAAAARAPRLESIDLRTGRRYTLFDPNPSLTAERFGPVEVFTWEDAQGHPFNGYLLLPPKQTAPRNLPLVITSYMCNGFLRGGNSDEYPEHVLAVAGFAVLCWNLDHEPVMARGIVDGMQYNLAGLEAAIDLLASRGIIDRQRVGLTGHSFGARNAMYAIANSKYFAAVATSSASDLQPYTRFLSAVPGGTQEAIQAAQGLPPPTNDPQGVWQRVSSALNAHKIVAPVLIQVADSELAGGALEFRAHMLRANKPLEIIVFPDETHQKWQPVHKLATAVRNVDWMRFWLQGYEDPDPDKRAQYARWRKLREMKGAP